ncbi:hypothetical protein LTR24_007493 [Lithohypha guttulata]|uniref:GPI-anchored cell surface glycoprotein n=1 Tax=Lithohypha guttulata TaxID=1690604 RepID=A0ABR0K373_9EURO|nr:hypothetical protein LTR24_007493 [Lithohypha guttulata]
MSLNGLDSDAVVQAHHAALAEAGGWFLLKYATRDTLELLDRGNGGVSEARHAVAQYEDKSPVYGLVQYRREKMILKYVPEGTSRLLQVRLAVHFQSILDTFIPYDTVFSFTTSEELSESALGLSTMLETNGSKPSSSSSLRQQRLKEITEDNEESAPAENATTSIDKEIDALPASAARARALLAKRKEQYSLSATILSNGQSTNYSLLCTEGRAALQPTKQSASPWPLPIRSSTIPVDKELPAPPAEESTPVSVFKDDVSIPRPSIDFSLPPLESDSDEDIRRPVPTRYSSHLSAAESTNISKWSDDVLASTRSKQKRAPRPHDDAPGRPKTSSNIEDGPARRVANLPTSVRVSSRSSVPSSRPGSRQSTRSVPARFVPSSNLPPPLPSPTFPAAPVQRPQQSQPSPSPASSMVMDRPAVTPEKMRLMKALQMRKRNQLLAPRSVSAAPTIPNTLASIGSSNSGLSDLLAASPSSNIGHPDAASQPPELGSIGESQTTSPTSLITTSDNHSTKPSSLSENSTGHASRTSLSSDTNSSTTPKAEVEKRHEERTKHQQRAKTASEHLLKSDTDPLGSATAGIESPKQLLQDSTPDKHDITETHTQKSDDQHDHGLLGDGHDYPTDKDTSRGVRSKKRYHFEGSIAIPPSSVGASDLSDDDSFMEELQNATVHEARPMAVNRTPVTPVLSRAPTNDFRDLTPIQTAIPKSQSSPNGSQASTPDRRRTASRAGSTRSLSTALPQWPPQPTEPVPALPRQKPALGGNISKRVRTFEGLSQREDSTSSPPIGDDQTARSAGLSNMFKRASFLPNRGDSTSEKLSSRAVPSPLRAEFPPTGDNTNPRPLVQRAGTSPEVFAPTHRGETVSVTARIVRDTIKPKSAHGTSDTRNLHRSPLVVEHETSAHDLRPQLPRELTTQSMSAFTTSPKSEKRRFSFNSQNHGVKSLSPTDTSTRSQRMSFAGHQKKSQSSPSETSSIVDEKRGSRTSRMLKRLSGLGKPKSRDSVILASSAQENQHPDTIEEQIEGPDPNVHRVVDIGEVNVQFPETLLWKRRFLRVDDEGYLIFAPPTNDFSTRGRSRKIHLDELHRPTLPDMEHEEMAWSIVLVLKTGGAFQCACESKAAQSNVLKSESRTIR